MKCGKACYRTRADAKRALQRIHGYGLPSKGLRPYHCTVCAAFHLGHLPKAVIRGRMSRGSVYGS